MINLQKIGLGAKGHWEYMIGLPLFLEPVATTLIWAQEITEDTDKPSNVMQIHHSCLRKQGVLLKI
jgi:hypothetical protein